MKLVLSVTFLFSILFCNAQKVIDVSKVEENPTKGLFYVVGGQPYSLAKYTKVVDGTPFFKDEWMRGSVIVKSGEQYDDQMLRLDLIDNEVHYLDSLGQEMISTDAIVEVLLKDSLLGNRYRFVYSSAISVPKSERPANGWYQLLSMGSANLFRKFQKEIVETRPYGAATYEQSIKTSSIFFVAYKNMFLRIKKIKDLPDILMDKRTELNNYINSKSLSGKTDSDYINLVEYYNSLQLK